jgi:3'(2'), 5'-bisphosphate nucleotidase
MHINSRQLHHTPILNRPVYEGQLLTLIKQNWYHLVTKSQILSNDDILYVREIAKQAGELAVQMRQGVEVREKTGPSDLVTAADIALSKLIVERLQARFPDDLIVSEEDEEHENHEEQAESGKHRRVWLVDPIDGTDNYVANDGQYSVMIGLLVDKVIDFGCVYAPASETIYFGGLTYGAWKATPHSQPKRYGKPPAIASDANARLMMGFRDRKINPWVMQHAKVSFVKAGSVGLKVAKILEDEADVFVHFAKKLKVWDTAGPAAIAQGGGLEVGTLEEDRLDFPLPEVVHSTSVIVARPNGLAWCRRHLSQSRADLPVQL